MARIKFTALVESIRGTIAGTTFQRNAYGYTAKSKPNMVNPNTASQTLRKQYFQQAQQRWLSLSAANRAAWNTYATTYPVPSHNNPAAYLSGYNLFVRWHALSYSTSGANLDNPSGAQGTISPTSYELINADPILEFNIGGSQTGGPWLVITYMTRPLKVTQEYLKSWTRDLGYVTDALPYSQDLGPEYEQLFGSLPEVGDTVGIDVTFLNTTNAQVIYIPTFSTEVIA